MKKENRQLFRLWLSCLAAVCALNLSAQKFEYPVHGENDTVRIAVSFKGKQPVITDYANAYLEFRKDSAFFAAVKEEWERHLQQAPLSPNVSIVEDVKHGYIHYEKIRPEEQDTLIFEMCFWNCADGKHKLFAMSDNSMVNGRFKEGQTTGIYFYLYDNARHIMWQVVDYLLGAEVDSGTEEGYEYNAETKLHYVKDRETGEPLALNEEEFYKWLDEKPVVVYRLPREGKDIIVEIQRANRTDTVRLEWDGMMFNRK